METSSIAMVIVLRLTGTTSLDVIPALSMILKCTIQQATRWMTTVSLMELLHLLLRHLPRNLTPKHPLASAQSASTVFTLRVVAMLASHLFLI
jgi:hypothetical protein